MKFSKIISLIFAWALSATLAAPTSSQRQESSEPSKASHKTDDRLVAKGPVVLNLVARYEFPPNAKGRLDHLIAELSGHRVFATSQGSRAVVVFDSQTHKVIRTIEGVAIPHGLLYRNDVDRLYVTDGSPGALKIYDGRNYNLIKSVELLPDTDSIAYDPTTRYLYVVNGGRDAKLPHSLISIIDTDTNSKMSDIKVDSPGLDGMAIEISGPRLYVTNVAQTKIEVIDRNTHTLIASWPLTLGKINVALALDESNHRLFVGCRSGEIVVLDTNTGRELERLPINQDIDELVFDAKSKRLFAVCGAHTGSVDVYEQTDPDHYKFIAQVPTGPGARTGRLVPELNRFLVAVPQHEGMSAEILEYSVN